MRKTAFILALMLPVYLVAQPGQTWRTGSLDGNVVALPGGCSFTWYDPEVFVYPDGNRGFLAQGGMASSCTANVGLDSLFRAKYNSATLTWQVPTANSCPTLVGAYATTACPGQNFFAPHQPLASPAIARVGNKYYMAFSGGNGDLRKGHIFWASSNDGVTWATFKWDPKPAGYSWKPVVYPKYGDFCEKFGIPQLTLTYDPSTDYGPEGAFYLHFNYMHRTGELDTYTFRFRYSSANGFGWGGGLQACLNSGPRGTPCTWTDHSGAMVFDYDTQPAEPNDPLLTRNGGNKRNFNYGGGSLAWEILDTRTDGGSLVSGQPRSISVAGKCGIPADTSAVSLNVTVFDPISGGNITLYPGDGALPPTTTVSFSPGITRTNNAITPLASDGTGSIAGYASLTASGQVDIIVDINGYFK